MTEHAPKEKQNRPTSKKDQINLQIHFSIIKPTLMFYSSKTA